MEGKSLLARALEKSPLFSGFSMDEGAFALASFPKGGVVPAEYGGAPALALVLSGRLQIDSGGSGHAVTLSTLLPGDCLGISTIFSGRALSTVPRCAQKTEVGFLPRESFRGMLRENPDLFERYAVLCNEKISYLTAKIAFLTTPSCRSRLVRFLLQHQNGDGVAELPVSKEKLAKMLGVSRASLFRELSLLAGQGLLSVEGRTVRIQSPDLADTMIESAL